MNKRADFIKKVESKQRKVSLDLEAIKKESKSSHSHRQSNVRISREDIAEFNFIGVFDRKVIAAFHNRLQLFGYFDLHALHERIRYQYYSWKIKNMQNSDAVSPFNEEVIEKGGRPAREIYGQRKKVVWKVGKQNIVFFKQKSNKATLWGIELQKNQTDEIYVTACRQILSRWFTFQDIQSVLAESNFKNTGKVPRVIDDWLGQYSCKSAYKFNDELSRQHAILLIQNLSRCTFPWFCVHGRNTVHVTSVLQLF